MTLMTDRIPDHVHISEREADGTWEDCTWDTGLEWYRLVYDARKPATHAEAQLLRRASGEPATGGSNYGDFARGVKARYGTTIPARISGYSALRAALTPGKVAAISGSMKVFGSTHRLSTYDRNFDGAHAVLLINIDGTLYWCDPEAPTTAAVPVKVTWAEVQLFVSALAGSHVVGKIKRLIQENPVENLTKQLLGYTAYIKPLSNVRAAPHITATKFRTVSTKEAVVLIGTVKGDADPGNAGNTTWYMWFKNGRYEFTAADNIVDLAAPTTGTIGITQQQLDAAVAAAKAELTKTIDAQAATIAELKTENAAASALQSALKAFLV